MCLSNRIKVIVNWYIGYHHNHSFIIFHVKFLKERKSPLSPPSYVFRTLEKKQIVSGNNSKNCITYKVYHWLAWLLICFICWLPFLSDRYLEGWKRWGPLFQSRSWSTRWIQCILLPLCLNKRQLNILF